jgi:hemolysin III
MGVEIAQGRRGIRRWLREPVAGLTHLVGVALAAVGLVLLVRRAAGGASTPEVVAAAVYGGTLTLLYLASSLYHLLPVSERGVQRLRRVDHMMIFVFIAGSYTPFCLGPLRPSWGIALLSVVWSLAVAGIVLKALWMGAPRWLTATIYLAMGWVVIVAVGPLVEALPQRALLGLFAGGLFYSLGAGIYAARRPDPWPGVFGFHEIWHLFVLAGSIWHFDAIWGLVA